MRKLSLSRLIQAHDALSHKLNPQETDAQNQNRQFSFWPCGMWDLSTPTRDRARYPLHWKPEDLTLDHQGSS